MTLQLIEKSEFCDFIGHGENPYESLTKYGFVCRNEKSNQYYCLYKLHDLGYEEGFVSETDIKEFLDEKTSYLSKEEINKFFNSIPMNKESYLNLSFLDKMRHLIKYFGNRDVFGPPVQNLTLKEVMHIVENE